MSELEPATPAQPPALAAGWHPWGAGMQRYFDGRQWTEHYAPLAPAPPVNVTSGSPGVAWVLAILTLGYMLPWAVAVSRGRPNAGAIGVVNLLTGWTLVGWIAALVMAAM